ncbi:MAG: efflux rane protein [Nocardioidaceae bacterium]|nr:efflux rane protein [Nocardioidaceae bacterium]
MKKRLSGLADSLAAIDTIGACFDIDASINYFHDVAPYSQTATTQERFMDQIDKAARRDRRLALCVLSLAMVMVGMDNSIVNVALPSIAKDFDAEVSELQWVVAGYVVVLGTLLLLSGSMADRFGRRTVFQLGLGLFLLGSLFCSLAPGLGWLVAARVLQAVGGSMLAPVTLSIIRHTFTDARERASAIGVWGAAGGLSVALGPVIGGILVGVFGWRAIFWVNIPIGLAAMVLAARFVVDSKAPHPRRVDPVGQILVITAVATLIYAIIEAPGKGWNSTEIVTLFVVSLVSFVGLLIYEPRRRDPLLELRFFRSAAFSGATGIALISFITLSGFLFLNTLYLQDSRGLSPLSAGLHTFPLAFSLAITSAIGGRIAGKFGARIPFMLSGAGLATAGLMLTGLTPTTPTWWLFLAYAIYGAGFGLQNPSTSIAAVTGMPPAQAGVAAAVASTARQVGASLGIAIIGSMAASGFVGDDIPHQLAEATHPGWWTIFGIGIGIIVLGWVSTTAWAARTAARAVAELEEVVAVQAPTNV